MRRLGTTGIRGTRRASGQGGRTASAGTLFDVVQVCSGGRALTKQDETPELEHAGRVTSHATEGAVNGSGGTDPSSVQ